MDANEIDGGTASLVKDDPTARWTGADEAHLRRAFDLAMQGLGLASPNPMVGAVIVDARGEIAGTGWHGGPGTAHAEARALAEAGPRARGGTLYVTLEPCTHRGRTPPCAPAIVDAGVARVVASVADPNPLVEGGGFAALRTAGVQASSGLLAREGHELIEAFTKAVTTGLPFVTVKFAMSLDGKVAARDGSSRWVTGQEARQDAHRLRARHDAIMVGAGTVLADDPALTVRLYGYRGRQPVRIVVDGAGRVPTSARIFDGTTPVWIATGGASSREARERWDAAGAQVWVEREAGVSVIALRTALARWAHPDRDRPLRSILIDGGPTLSWSAVAEGLVDRIVVYVAPKLIGGVDAPSALGGAGIGAIEDALGLRIEAVERLGDDLKIVARPRTVGHVRR